MRRLPQIVVLVLATTACGRGLIYHPTSLDEAGLAELPKIPGWQLQRVQGEETLVGVVRPASGPEQPWLLYFAGNAQSLGDSQTVLRLLAGPRGWGLAVWAYRGYDTSGGSPTQEGLQHDGQVLAHYLFDTLKVPPKQLFLVGQSLGSGIAAPLAASLATEGKAPAGLILVSAYTSMSRLFKEHAFNLPVGWMAADSYDTMDSVDSIRSPVLLVHGDHDTLIPIEHSDDLAKALGQRAQVLRSHGFGHNNIWQDPHAAAGVEAFVEQHHPPG